MAKSHFHLKQLQQISLHAHEWSSLPELDLSWLSWMQWTDRKEGEREWKKCVTVTNGNESLCRATAKWKCLIHQAWNTSVTNRCHAQVQGHAFFTSSVLWCSWWLVCHFWEWRPLFDDNTYICIFHGYISTTAADLTTIPICYLWYTLTQNQTMSTGFMNIFYLWVVLSCSNGRLWRHKEGDDCGIKRNKARSSVLPTLYFLSPGKTYAIKKLFGISLERGFLIFGATSPNSDASMYLNNNGHFEICVL